MRKEKNIYGFTSIKERRQVLARLRAAAWMGLIDSAGLEAAEERRKRKNAETEKRLEEGGTVYGLTHYTPAMYLQYELTRLKLDYTVHARTCPEHDTRRSANNACFGETDGLHPVGPVQGKSQVTRSGRTNGIDPARYSCREITEEEKRAFYVENQDLFTRYWGDSFAFDEVSMIIEKRLREQEYERIVQDCCSVQDCRSVQDCHSLQGSACPELPAEEHTDFQNGQKLRSCCQEVEKSGHGQALRNSGQSDENIRHEQALQSSSQVLSDTGHIRRIYYVSSASGCDENDGSREHPFATLFAVNQLQLRPGDQVLLERGAVFRGQFLHLSACGTEDAPILIGAYGEGTRPRIEAMGQGIWYQDYGTELDSSTHTREGYVSSAVLLYDCAYITLRGLSITNQGSLIGEIYEAPRKMNRTGVAVVAKNGGTLREIHLADLEIRDVNGNVYDKHMNNGGIYFTCLKPEDEKATGIARYEGVSVTGCFVHRVSRWGIAVGYTYQCKKFMKAELEEELFEKYGHRDIRIADNYVKEAGGDGITVMYALRPLVEHNTADSCAGEMNDRIYKYPEGRGGKVAAGIWPWKCRDALFQYNEAADTRLNQDGMAWDADSGDGTIYQYNYSRLNEGGCVMFCLEESIHNTFRYNVSDDDLGGTISPSGNPDAYIHHNTFIKRKGVPFVRERMDGGKFTEEENEIREI